MKITKYFCDYCGKETKLRKCITPKWRVVSESVFYGRELVFLEGEACLDCWESYKKWSKSRKAGR